MKAIKSEFILQGTLENVTIPAVDIGEAIDRYLHDPEFAGVFIDLIDTRHAVASGSGISMDWTTCDRYKD